MIQLIKNTANSLLHELQVTATRKVRKGELKFSEESSKTERGIQTNKQNNNKKPESLRLSGIFTKTGP